MKKIILVFCLLSALTACSGAPEDLTSPCVGAEGSPCDRRPVNDWWRA